MCLLGFREQGSSYLGRLTVDLAVLGRKRAHCLTTRRTDRPTDRLTRQHQASHSMHALKVTS
eukprot:1386323-Rhodomonas_salina.1